MQRRIIWFLLMTIMLLSVENSMADQVDYNSGNLSWTIRCDHGKPLSQVSFIALRGEEANYIINENTVIYLNQFTADANGHVEVVFVGSLFEKTLFLLGGAEGKSGLHVVGSFDPDTDLKTFRMPQNVTIIEEEAFAENTMQYVVIGNSVETIGDRAFLNCTELRLIDIPDSVTSFGEEVFKGCDALIIRCSPDSEAYRYAQENQIKYELVNGGNE